jgi:hypothetical protein
MFLAIACMCHKRAALHNYIYRDGELIGITVLSESCYI